MICRSQRTRRRRGIVLVASLWVMGILVILALNLIYRARLNMALTDYREDLVEGEALLKSGLARALNAIASDGDPETDHRAEAWGLSPSMREERILAERYLYLDDEPVTWRAIDEESKLNINIAPAEVIAQLFQAIYPDLDSQALAGHIHHWVHKSDSLAFDGDHYGSLTPPYEPRGEAMPFLEELLAIRGISEDLFFGLSLKENQASIPARFADAGVLRTGFRDFVTVYGDGSINVNTAPRATLKAVLTAALPEAEAEQAAAELHRLRCGGDGLPGTADDVPFYSTEGIANVVGVRAYQQCRNLGLPLTVKSGAFTVAVEVRLAKEKIYLNGRGLVLRDGAESKLAFWRPESL